MALLIPYSSFFIFHFHLSLAASRIPNLNNER